MRRENPQGVNIFKMSDGNRKANEAMKKQNMLKQIMRLSRIISSR